MPEFANPEAYERWMGRWSAKLAPAFVRFAELPSGGRFLDVGSGTGVLAGALIAGVGDATVVGIEPSLSYVSHSRTRIGGPRITFQCGDAMDIPFAEDAFDATLSLLILQELADAAEAVREMCRVTKAGGIVAASQWNFASGMPMLALFWDTAIETVDDRRTREAAAGCMEVGYPDEAALRRLWSDAGLVDTVTQLQSIEMTFESFDDYWAPFMSGVTQTASYAPGLEEGARNALRDRLRDKVAGRANEAPFTLAAEAWAIKGVVTPDSVARPS